MAVIHLVICIIMWTLVHLRIICPKEIVLVRFVPSPNTLPLLAWHARHVLCFCAQGIDQCVFKTVETLVLVHLKLFIMRRRLAWQCTLVILEMIVSVSQHCLLREMVSIWFMSHIRQLQLSLNCTLPILLSSTSFKWIPIHVKRIIRIYQSTRSHVRRCGLLFWRERWIVESLESLRSLVLFIHVHMVLW